MLNSWGERRRSPGCGRWKLEKQKTRRPQLRCNALLFARLTLHVRIKRIGVKTVDFYPANSSVRQFIHLFPLARRIVAVKLK
jgi:hypothetical protein